MTAERTIPSATVTAALKTLGIDIPRSDIIWIQMSAKTVKLMTWPNFDILNWRIVDECPSCHTANGHPHTEYCQLVAPAEYPGQPDHCTVTTEPEPWVDNGCRCPNPDQHHPGCPAIEQPACDGPNCG